MRKYTIKFPSGTSTLFIGMECPASLFLGGERGKTLLLVESSTADYSVTFYEDARVVNPPRIDIISALTYHFGNIRGLPPYSLEIMIGGTPELLPKPYTGGTHVKILLDECKSISRHTIEILGAPVDVLTVRASDTTRIIKCTECKTKILSRLRAVDNLPFAGRALSFSVNGKNIVALSTDRHPAHDTLSGICHILASEGNRGEVSLECDGNIFDFLIDTDGRVYAVYNFG